MKFRIFLATLWSVALILLTSGVTMSLTAPEPLGHAPALKACSTEDSHDCVWDARIHGNGTGRSFVDLDGKTYYLESK